MKQTRGIAVEVDYGPSFGIFRETSTLSFVTCSALCQGFEKFGVACFWGRLAFGHHQFGRPGISSHSFTVYRLHLQSRSGIQGTWSPDRLETTIIRNHPISPRTKSVCEWRKIHNILMLWCPQQFMIISLDLRLKGRYILSIIGSRHYQDCCLNFENWRVRPDRPLLCVRWFSNPKQVSSYNLCELKSISRETQ